MDRSTKEFFDRYQLPYPTKEEHGTEEDIRKNLVPAKVSKWHLEGNKLTATTDIGTSVTYIDPMYICKGMDDDGKPILQKIEM